MSVDSLYNGIVERLTLLGRIKEISDELAAITNNGDRTLYIYSIIRDLNAFPFVIEVQKTQKVSTHYRNLGNKCFQKSEDYMAWQYYNLSLMHAPSHSDHYALALANRSAVFFSLKKYKECLKDIETVFAMMYPEKLKDKLLRRKTACQESSIEENSVNGVETHEIQDILEMKTPKDPHYLCASTKLEVVWTKEMGRHIIAKEDIKVGEVLVEEDPYLVLLLKSQFLFGCNYCLSRSLNLLPCDNCCFALYCSNKCKDNAWREYHKIECALMPTLIHVNFTKLELLALRTTIKARTDHSDWSSLLKTIANAEANENSKLRGHVKIGDEWIFDSKYYTSIHTLASNIEKRLISDIFQKCVSAAIFLNLLETKTDFLECNDDKERQKIKRCVAGTLLLHIMTSPTNMHGISTNLETKEGNFDDEISLASAPYAFHSLLNHSCCPNVVRFTKLGSGHMTLFALRPIKKGMQLFDNYGSHHALEDRKSRQNSLKFQYKFTCVCEACLNDWPTYLNLRPGRNVPTQIRLLRKKLLGPDTINKLQKGDKAKCVELFKPLCELTESLEPYAPCIELADCQESLKQCMVVLMGCVPYGYSKLVDWEAIPPQV